MEPGKNLVTNGLKECELMFALFNAKSPPYDPCIRVLDEDFYIQVHGAKRRDRKWEVCGIAIPLRPYRDLVSLQANPWRAQTKKYEYIYLADPETGEGTIEFMPCGSQQAA